jgi:uncharacterized protein (DUF1778 family)
MATYDKNANRKRPGHIRVMVSFEEKAEMQHAANELGMALSVFLRWAALEAARQRRKAA